MVPIRNLAQNTPLLYACGFSLPLSTARPPHYSRIPESQKNPVMTTIIMLTSFLLFPIVWAAAYQLFHRYLTVCCCTAHLYAAGCAYLLTYLDTLPASRKSGFPWPALQNAKFWEKIAGYFPCSIHLAEPLDSTQKYIFAAFPHGACSLNHIITMTNACGMLSQHYTGQRRDLAATVLHWIPLFKDFLLALGCVDASAATAKHNLNKGRSILIYIGGEKEQLMTSPGQQRIYLKHRKGFIKLALQYGKPPWCDCDLVRVPLCQPLALCLSISHVMSLRCFHSHRPMFLVGMSSGRI